MLQIKIRNRLSTRVKNDRYRRLSAEDAGGGQRREVAIQTRRGLPYYLPTTKPPSVDVVAAIRSLSSSDSEGDMESLKKVTFPERRRLIVHCRLPLTRIKDKFGWMFTTVEVCAFHYCIRCLLLCCLFGLQGHAGPCNTRTLFSLEFCCSISEFNR